MVEQEKQGWDKRAWLIGILGGTICGSFAAWAGYTPIAQRLYAVLHLTNGARWVSGIAGFLSLLVLPGLLSGIARRRTFFWGILPLILSLVAIDAEDWVENGPKIVAQNFWVWLLIIGGCLLVSSGPVSLFRWLRTRAPRRREAAFAALEAQREAASIPQEGVWPPPPDYRK